MNEKEERPQSEDRPVPLWIKIMWALGLLWMAAYVLYGLRASPLTW